MSAYFISSTISILLLSFMELLLPDGKSKKSVSVVFSLICVFIIVVPIYNFIKNKDVNFYEDSYVEFSNNLENIYLKNLAIDILKSNDVEYIFISVENKENVKYINVTLDKSLENKNIENLLIEKLNVSNECVKISYE